MKKYQILVPIFILWLIALNSSEKISNFFWKKAPPGCNDVETSFSLPIRPIAQESDEWCWAASLEMAIKMYYPSSSISQCQIATERVKLLSPTTTESACECMVNDTIKKCRIFLKSDKQSGICKIFMSSLDADLSIAQPTIDSLLLRHSLKTKRLSSLKEIKQHLILRHPIIAIYGNRVGSSQHAVIVKGFTDVSTDRSYLHINNPLNNKKADCTFCYHWILVNCAARNLNDNSGIGKGTYGDAIKGSVIPLYFAIIPKP